MSELISIRKYAMRKNCSDPAVLKAIKTGKIVKGCVIDEHGKKKINPEIADAEWASNSDPLRAKMGDRFDLSAAIPKGFERVPKQAIKAKPEPKPKPVVPSYPAVKSLQDETLASARKAQEVYKAKIAEVDYKKRIGELVVKADVYKALFAFGQELRTQFQAIPDRVVDNMLAASNRNEAHNILYEAITVVLEYLSDIDSRSIT